MRAQLTVSLIVALMRITSAQVNAERELKLAPGRFPQIAGSELGQSIAFENEIDLHSCFPLLMEGQIVAWIHRAHAASRRVLVQRCVEYDPSIVQTGGNRHGGVRDLWDRVVIGRAGHRLQFVAVTPNGWELFANPSFCGHLVAYWGTPQNILAPSIYDITSGRLVASRSLGRVELETDDESFLPPPAWDASCVKAAFDGTRAGKARIELPINR